MNKEKWVQSLRSLSVDSFVELTKAFDFIVNGEKKTDNSQALDSIQFIVDKRDAERWRFASQDHTICSQPSIPYVVVPTYDKGHFKGAKAVYGLEAGKAVDTAREMFSNSEASIANNKMLLEKFLSTLIDAGLTRLGEVGEPYISRNAMNEVLNTVLHRMVYVEYAKLAKRVDELEAVLVETKKVLMLSDPNFDRAEISYGGIEKAVEGLCESMGYGAVMDCASILWRKRAFSGAFTVGACVGTLEATIKQIDEVLSKNPEPQAYEKAPEEVTPLSHCTTCGATDGGGCGECPTGEKVECEKCGDSGLAEMPVSGNLYPCPNCNPPHAWTPADLYGTCELRKVREDGDCIIAECIVHGGNSAWSKPEWNAKREKGKVEDNGF